MPKANNSIVCYVSNW